LSERSGAQSSATIVSTSRIPAQNFVVVDRQGRIAWTIAGRIPRRFGHDGQEPQSWADGTRGWDGWLRPDEYPNVIDPEAGRIWTANNRVANQADQRVLGYGGLAMGARAAQIRDGLAALEQATPQDLLAIQLDDRSLFLERWRDLLLATLDDEAISTDPRLAELRDVVEQTWTGRASVDSAAYRMVRAFRFDVGDKVMAGVTAPCVEVDEDFRFWRATGQWEAPLWTLVAEQPPHLLSPEFASWHELFVAVAVGILDYFEEQPGESLEDKSWGARNTVRIQHPLARAVPLLSDWLDIVPEQLPGDSNMPRVQAPGFGASQRMVVSPGREEEGLAHMPGGQSGHPLSPYYRAGHRAWADGRPTPFLPGPAAHTLTLLP
jgi:penicillin amidase